VRRFPSDQRAYDPITWMQEASWAVDQGYARIDNGGLELTDRGRQMSADGLASEYELYRRETWGPRAIRGRPCGRLEIRDDVRALVDG
jgi:hypothetical protein